MQNACRNNCNQPRLALVDRQHHAPSKIACSSITSLTTSFRSTHPAVHDMLLVFHAGIAGQNHGTVGQNYATVGQNHGMN